MISNNARRVSRVKQKVYAHKLYKKKGRRVVRAYKRSLAIARTWPSQTTRRMDLQGAERGDAKPGAADG